MDNEVLVVVCMVFLVVFVGFFSITPKTEFGMKLAQHDITANVVRDECSACTGDWVCAAKDGSVTNYPSACAATCAGARVIFTDYCENVPKATTK